MKVSRRLPRGQAAAGGLARARRPRAGAVGGDAEFGEGLLGWAGRPVAGDGVLGERLAAGAPFQTEGGPGGQSALDSSWPAVASPAAGSERKAEEEEREDEADTSVPTALTEDAAAAAAMAAVYDCQYRFQVLLGATAGGTAAVRALIVQYARRGLIDPGLLNLLKAGEAEAAEAGEAGKAAFFANARAACERERAAAEERVRSAGPSAAT